MDSERLCPRASRSRRELEEQKKQLVVWTTGDRINLNALRLMLGRWRDGSSELDNLVTAQGKLWPIKG